MLTLDHIAIGCETLDAGTAWVEEALGVTLLPGGTHDRYGTHNRLLGLADGLYLEVIAKNPDAAPTGRPTWFGLDDFTGRPRLANWICRSADIATAPALAGRITPLTRGDLAWQITVPDDGSLPMQGGFPTILQWGDGVTPPSDRLPHSGCRLTRWEVHHPKADWLAANSGVSDPRVHFVPAETPGFRAAFDTPHGARVLG